jgi:hypothetical protein
LGAWELDITTAVAHTRDYSALIGLGLGIFVVASFLIIAPKRKAKLRSIILTAWRGIGGISRSTRADEFMGLERFGLSTVVLSPVLKPNLYIKSDIRSVMFRYSGIGANTRRKRVPELLFRLEQRD